MGFIPNQMTKLKLGLTTGLTEITASMCGLEITGLGGSYILWTKKGQNERQLERATEGQEREKRVI